MPTDYRVERLMLRGNDIVIRAGWVDGLRIGTLVRADDVLIAVDRPARDPRSEWGERK